MTDKHITVFNSVCRQRSMSGAAEELFISQPAISRYIHDLERYYNCTLFIRKKNGLVLTEQGEILHTYMQTFEAGLDALDRRLLNCSTHKNYRLGVIPSLAETVLPAILDEIELQYPDVRISIHVDTTSRLDHLIKNDELDIVLTDKSLESARLSEYPVLDSPMVVLSAENADLPESMTVQELAAHEILLKEVGSGNRNQVDAMFSQIGRVADGKIVSTSNSFLMQQCARGRGLIIISEATGKIYQKQYGLKMVTLSDCDMQHVFYIGYKKEMGVYLGYDNVLKLIKSAIKKETT